jgi:ATP-dependent Lon protease
MKEIKEKKQIKKPTAKSKISRKLILPVIPIREGLLLPHSESVLSFSRKLSLNAINHLSKINKSQIILTTQIDPSLEELEAEDLYKIGTLANIDRVFEIDGNTNALVKSTKRIKIIKFLKIKPFIIVEAEILPEKIPRDSEMEALIEHLKNEFKKIMKFGKPVDFTNFIKVSNHLKANEVIDQIANNLSLNTQEKQLILETLNLKERAKLVSMFAAKELKVFEIEKDVIKKTQKQFDKTMKENILRERLKTIQKELGELDNEEEVSSEYSQKLKNLKVSQKIKTKISKEIKRFKQMSTHNPESSYLRNWIDIIFELPWKKETKDNFDIEKAEKILESTHFGLEEVKERILEYIAVLKLQQLNKKNKFQPTILCFVGPPGVGKTSIGQSIAKALNREFVKMSLGGVRDESEIRGHRRTYVGAMPGKIINALKQAGSKNPVFMLDEIDKLDSDYRGDPSAALLEALDPEQNETFEDHYLDIPFDLSKVIFITTANTLDIIPSLRDRMEIIRYSGYTTDEKVKIGKKYLVKKSLEINGLDNHKIEIGDKVLKNIVENYTQEAGVRELNRKISKIFRKIAKLILEKKIKFPYKLDLEKVAKLLGPKEYDVSLAEKKDEVGVTTGMAWTSVGGEILYIEGSIFKGTGNLKLTGQLGDVMKESAQAAYTFVKSKAKKLKIKPEKFEKSDIHIHVPEGAVPKDGPSAGVTLATTLISLFTNRKVRKSIAMTGEITLRGHVLKIGGLKEKIIAAHRAGCKTIILPKSNQPDLEKIPDNIKNELEFKLVEHIDEVIKFALV